MTRILNSLLSRHLPQIWEMRITDRAFGDAASNDVTRTVYSDFLPDQFEAADMAYEGEFFVKVRPVLDWSPDRHQNVASTLVGNWQIGNRGALYFAAACIVALILAVTITEYLHEDRPVTVNHASACLAEQDGDFDRFAFGDCLEKGR